MCHCNNNQNQKEEEKGEDNQRRGTTTAAIIMWGEESQRPLPLRPASSSSHDCQDDDRFKKLVDIIDEALEIINNDDDFDD